MSMGWAAARKLRRGHRRSDPGAGDRGSHAARGIELRHPLTPAPATAAVIAAVREHVGGPGGDRYLAPEISAVAELARTGALVRAAESVVGALS